MSQPLEVAVEILVRGPYTLARVEDRPERVSLDRRAFERAEPSFDEPLSFDRTVEKAGRKT